MLKDIQSFIKKCRKCKANKACKSTKIPLTLTSTSSRPFQRVAFDIVGPLPTTENYNNFLLTFQDDLTKFPGAIPIKNQEANTVAKALCENFVTKYGIPEKILTDRGSNFMSVIFKEMCKLLKIKHLTTTAFHPQTNGALERSHSTLKEYLKNFADIDRQNWDVMVCYATFVYNTTPHSATRFTPYELIFGQPANIPSAVKKEPEPVYTLDDYVSELKARLRLTHSVARKNLEKRKEITKRSYDKNTSTFVVDIGDKVWLKNDARRTKQDPLWLGPCEVTEVHSPTNTTIKINGKLKKVHNNKLKKD